MSIPTRPDNVKNLSHQPGLMAKVTSALSDFSFFHFSIKAASKIVSL